MKQSMRAFVLNGAVEESDCAAEIGKRTASWLQKNQWQVDLFNVWEKSIGYCLGCGACNDKSPGVCIQKDDGRYLAERTAECDLMVFISPISFGGYAGIAKKAIERTLPNIHPLFLRHRGELHHRYRYQRAPSLLVLGWQAVPDGDEAQIFRKIAERNAVNYLSPRHGSLVVSGIPDPVILGDQLSSIFSKMERTSWETTEMLPFPSAETGPFGDISTPVLILGASQHKHSNSRSVMEYLVKRIEGCGAQGQAIDLASSGLLTGNKDPFLAAARSAGRIILVSPLYHDTLSYAATYALETLQAHKCDLPSSLNFSAFVHSGYPEPVHTRTALAACRQFAIKMGWNWQGGLTAGATSPIGGQPLENAGRMTKHLRNGLDLASEALAHGHPIPDNAVQAAARCFIPPFLFCWVANHMLRKKVKASGKDINARPYAKP